VIWHQDFTLAPSAPCREPRPQRLFLHGRPELGKKSAAVFAEAVYQQMLLKAQEARPAGTFALGAAITVTTLAGRAEVLFALLARIPSNCHGATAASDRSAPTIGSSAVRSLPGCVAQAVLGRSRNGDCRWAGCGISVCVATTLIDPGARESRSAGPAAALLCIETRGVSSWFETWVCAADLAGSLGFR
jgi:hypothetical protein